MRCRDPEPDAALLRLVTTLIASEVERVRAPERASEEAATSFQRGGARAADPRPRRPRRPRQGARHRSVVAAAPSSSSAPTRATPPRMTGAGGCWRSPARGARSVAPGAIAAPAEDDAGEIVVLVPDADGEAGRRVTAGRSCASSSRASPDSRSRSVAAAAPRTRVDLHRAGNEALLAANVVEGDPERSSSALRRPAPTSCCCRT